MFGRGFGGYGYGPTYAMMFGGYDDEDSLGRERDGWAEISQSQLRLLATAKNLFDKMLRSLTPEDFNGAGANAVVSREIIEFHLTGKARTMFSKFVKLNLGCNVKNRQLSAQEKAKLPKYSKQKRAIFFVSVSVSRQGWEKYAAAKGFTPATSAAGASSAAKTPKAKKAKKIPTAKKAKTVGVGAGASSSSAAGASSGSAVSASGSAAAVKARIAANKILQTKQPVRPVAATAAAAAPTTPTTTPTPTTTVGRSTTAAATETAAEKRKRINDNKIKIGGSTPVATSTAETPAAKRKRIALMINALPVAPAAAAVGSASSQPIAATAPAAVADRPPATALVARGMHVTKPQLLKALAAFYAVHNPTKTESDYAYVADWCYRNWDLPRLFEQLMTTYKVDFTPFLRAVVSQPTQ